ncbi:MAG: gfo/Idh/MocA family oxidoreductase [Deltaproteobacteria bacterium]|nr:gfo/Idh/MocA family oxidoreductase [Deltaproteobacteria bacterium]
MIEAADKNRVKLLVHSKANDPPVIKVRETVASGQLGRLIQINTWNYKGWLRSARLPAEVDTAKGGGVVYRQGAHQVDIVRFIGGGLVKSVRAVTGKWNRNFDTEGNFTAFLEFEDGTPATLVFNGYGYFDMTEMTWGIGEGGKKALKKTPKTPSPKGAVNASQRYAMPRRAELRKQGREVFQPIFGLTLVSCERGDIRQSPEGLFIYSEKGQTELLCAPFFDRGTELLNLSNAVNEGTSIPTDGRWGKATLEVLLAILQSSEKGREVKLKHQVPNEH